MKCLDVIFFVLAVGSCFASNLNDSNIICSGENFLHKKNYVLTDEDPPLPYATEYHAECLDDAQCEWLGENSECKYVCKCKDGYRWYLGQCRKYVGLGESCSEDLDCYDGYNLQSLSCLEEKCVCSDGYYQRGNIDCRKIASNINDTCALDIDCQVDNTITVCHIGKCLEASQYEALLMNTIEEMEEIEEIKETSLLLNAKIGTTCESDTNCEGLPNSECYNRTKTCICKKQYFWSEDSATCLPELGVPTGCANDSDCPLKPGKCVDGVCYCRDYYFVEDGNRNCIKTFSQKNWNCLSKEWCYALGPFSYCASNGTCECSKIAEFDEENVLCNQISQKDENMCTNDFECKYIKNGVCVDEACGCMKNFVQVDDACLPELGAACGDEVPCEPLNSECSSDGRCQCKEDYIVVGNSCSLKTDGLGADCSTDDQCSYAVPYSKCRDRKCVCDDDRVQHNDTCYQRTVFGSYCNNRLECSLSSSSSIRDLIVCRNRKCQCPTGYTKKGNECSSASLTTANFIIVIGTLLLKGVL